VTSIDRTAYPRFKRMITTRELAGSFTPSNEEIEWARDMTLSDPHLLALTVWLKSYQRLGYFPKLDEVPQVVVEHVREALRLPAESWPNSMQHGRRNGIASSSVRGWG
jgi:hypothetical protein